MSRNRRRIMNLNKIVLVLIFSSGFLLIIYANNFNRRSFFTEKAFQEQQISETAVEKIYTEPSANHREIPSASELRAPSSSKNSTDFNIFIIYTKENMILKSKFELFLKSLLKFATIPIQLNLITDESSESSIETLVKNQITIYKKKDTVKWTLYDVNDSVIKINDIVNNVMPLFSYSSGSYYNDALFLLSLGLHRIVDKKMHRAILIDCDVVFRSDVKELFDQFNNFSPDNIIGMAPELTPVYRHILYKYRAKNPHTLFGSPYYLVKKMPNIKKQRNNSHTIEYSSTKHGYPGLNSGIILMNFDRIRKSRLYEESLKSENIKRIIEKYSFRGHLGDQDFYTVLGYEFPDLIYRLDCIWNRQLCTWWKNHGYSDIFDNYFHCEGDVKVYHGNCNTRIPE